MRVPLTLFATRIFACASQIHRCCHALFAVGMSTADSRHGARFCCASWVPSSSPARRNPPLRPGGYARQQSRHQRPLSRAVGAARSAGGAPSREPTACGRCGYQPSKQLDAPPVPSSRVLEPAVVLAERNVGTSQLPLALHSCTPVVNGPPRHADSRSRRHRTAEGCTCGAAFTILSNSHQSHPPTSAVEVAVAVRIVALVAQVTPCCDVCIFRRVSSSLTLSLWSCCFVNYLHALACRSSRAQCA